MVVAYRPATADRWVASRCTAPLWDVTPAEGENARTSARRTGIVMIDVINLSPGTITVTRTGTTASGTATMVSAAGATTDHIRKGLGVEVPASAAGGTTDRIRKGLGVEVPASATATAARQPPMVSGTLETDSSRLEGSSIRAQELPSSGSVSP